MPLTHTKRERKESKFEEKGYLARVVQIIDLGKQHQIDPITRADKESKFEVMFTFEFPTVRNDEDLPCWLSRRYAFPQSWPDKTGLKTNTNLYKIFSTFHPKYLTQSDKYPEYYFFDADIWESLLNTPVYIEIVKTNKGYDRIKSISKVPDFAGEVPPLENDPILFDSGSASIDEWLAIFPWARKVVLDAEDEETRDAALALEKQVDANKEPEPKDKDEVDEEDLPF